jgi:hypothetical protein
LLLDLIGRALIGSLVLGSVGAFLAQPAEAGALHGFCVSPTPACSDNGAITPTTSPSPHFGFLASPNSGSATFFLDILIPNNVAGGNALQFTVSGTHTGVGTLSSSVFSSAAWTSGQLDAYLGISASPTNPIGAFLPLTQLFEPSATGYFNYVFDFGSVTFGSTSDPTFLTSLTFPEGSIILGFADAISCHRGVCTDNWTATANSAALIVDDDVPGLNPVPEPGSLLLLISGLLGFGIIHSRKRT